MRVPFNEVFNDNGDGSYTPRGAVRIGGVTMGAGVAVRGGLSFSGVDIAQYAGKDLEVERSSDGLSMIEIKGTY